ncbi:protein of unknown function [Arenibacter nanhaiticus]|uniref:DUF4468 domain-containing protein n=1 Tax=Arenibacter nanhaiticus TaxID=558155 RepID=A0A1M6KX70_9FLAO|nr:DUF4468 domain-containing protein [Arenibacter nanhaiticus]SHJ63548.1 protein of unknown function [Arenibacter nanhaiticus]
MKRKFLVLLVGMFTCIINSQEVLTFSDVVEVENVLSTNLYNRAKLWFASAYKSSNDVLQVENKEEGMLIGKGSISYEQPFLSGMNTTVGNVNYLIKIFVKDGRYKYEITNFIHHGASESFGLITTDDNYPRNTKKSALKWENRVWNDIKNQVDLEVRSLIPSIKEGMRESIASENENW